MGLDHLPALVLLLPQSLLHAFDPELGLMQQIPDEVHTRQVLWQVAVCVLQQDAELDEGEIRLLERVFL
jgi:hypothetical protein